AAPGAAGRPRPAQPAGGTDLFPGGATALTTGDFNADGRPDVAASASPGSNGQVTVVFGQADGTLLPGPSYSCCGKAADAVVAADFDNDGVSDLAVSGYYAGTVSLFRGNGDGTFQSAGAFAAGWHPYGLAAADLNGDGAVDLAVTNSAENGAVVVALND